MTRPLVNASMSGTTRCRVVVSGEEDDSMETTMRLEPVENPKSWMLNIAYKLRSEA